ncbi:MAG: hypothetical protein JW700_03770 [Candidatus Aenigmarchaeota archaeon]|nr:hypothetical protein [Candidatus Aenigmarchaeota archaeon]
MKRFIFIKGKNPLLSKMEIEMYLQNMNKRYSIIEDLDDFLVVDTSISPDIINDLGGTLKIVEVIEEWEEASDDAMDKVQEMVTARNFGLSVYAERNEHEIYKEMGKLLKQKLRSNGVKAKYMGIAKSMRPQMSNVDLLRKGVPNECTEIVVCVSDDIYIGVTRSLHNPMEYRKRDMERPMQRPIYSIPPRLANIMLNFAGAKPGDLVLDPFCGIGTILQEAAIRGMRIAGIDNDRECVDAAKINLHWLSEEYKIDVEEGLIGVGSATDLLAHFPRNSVDAIATEPYLGPPLRGRVTERDVRKIFKELDVLYKKTLKSMSAVLKSGGRAAIISPCIRMQKGKVSHFEFQKLAKGSSFKIIESVIDAEKRHKVQREIFIIEKR